VWIILFCAGEVLIVAVFYFNFAQNRKMKKILLTLLVPSLLGIGACKKDTTTTAIEPEAISCSDITANKVLKDRGEGIDYTLDCVVSVFAQLTIEPGVVIQCGANAGFWVNSGGALVAVGTAAKPINFKSKAATPGLWKGIYFQSNSPLNELNNCTVENAGSASVDGDLSSKAAVRVSATGKLKLTNTKIIGSGYDGLLIDGIVSEQNNPIAAFSNNEFTGNANYPISTLATVLNSLDGAGSQYQGNTQNKILVRGGVLVGTHVWKKLAVPYIVKNTVVVGDYGNAGDLTIQPGVVVQFALDQGLTIGDYANSSSLKIIGTATERIVLTGESLLPGAWKGIAFQSNSPLNEIRYADISYAGASSFTGNTSQKGNVVAGAYSAGTFKISYSTISGSAAYGIYVTMPSANIDTTNQVTFSSNASGNYYKE